MVRATFVGFLLLIAAGGCSREAANDKGQPSSGSPEAKRSEPIVEVSEEDAKNGFLALNGLIVSNPDQSIANVVLVQKGADKDMKLLGGRRQLTGLTLVNCKEITDEGMRFVAALPALERLSLEDTAVTDAGLKEIGKLSGLIDLKLAGSFTDTGLKELSGLTKLTRLDVTGCKITGEGLAPLQATKLKTLVLPESARTNAGLKNYVRLVDYRMREPDKYGPYPNHLYMSFANWNVTDEALSAFAGCAKLTALDLSNTKITGEGLSALGGCSKLELLDLSNTKITGPGLNGLKDLPNLFKLIIDNCPIKNDGFKDLTGFTHLSDFYLKGVKADEEMLRPLASETFGYVNTNKFGSVGTQVIISSEEVAARLNKGRAQVRFMVFR